MKNIQNKLSKNLWDNFQSVEHFHKILRYFTQEKGNIIIETLQNIISNTHNIKDNDPNLTFHKSHLRESFDDHKRYLVLIPHEDNEYYKLVKAWLTPHITLGTYDGVLADGQLLNLFRTIKDSVFETKKDEIFHIQPDIQDIKMKFKKIK